MNPNAALKQAIECLQDVVSHADSFRQVLEASKKDTIGDADPDATEFDRWERAREISHYQHEIEVIERMRKQASAALDGLRGTRIMDLDAVIDGASVFIGMHGLKTFGVPARLLESVVYAALNAKVLDYPFKGLVEQVSFDVNGKQGILDPVLVRYIRSLAQFLPRPKETALTIVEVHVNPTLYGTPTILKHVSSLEVGDRFNFRANKNKIHICTEPTTIVYGDEPMYRIVSRDEAEDVAETTDE